MLKVLVVDDEAVVRRGIVLGVDWAKIGCAVVGEAADTTIFCVVAFAGIISGGTLLNYIVVGYLYKVSIEALFLPVTYRVIAAVKRREPSYPRPA